jgi:hypothetical protein
MATTLLKKLTMVPAPTGGTDPTIRRRFRIATHIDEQLALLENPKYVRSRGSAAMVRSSRSRRRSARRGS